MDRVIRFTLLMLLSAFPVLAERPPIMTKTTPFLDVLNPKIFEKYPAQLCLDSQLLEMCALLPWDRRNGEGVIQENGLGVVFLFDHDPQGKYAERLKFINAQDYHDVIAADLLWRANFIRGVDKAQLHSLLIVFLAPDEAAGELRIDDIYRLQKSDFMRLSPMAGRQIIDQLIADGQLKNFSEQIMTVMRKLEK